MRMARVQGIGKPMMERQMDKSMEQWKLGYVSFTRNDYQHSVCVFFNVALVSAYGVP